MNTGNINRAHGSDALDELAHCASQVREPAKPITKPDGLPVYWALYAQGCTAKIDSATFIRFLSLDFEVGQNVLRPLNFFLIAIAPD